MGEGQTAMVFKAFCDENRVRILNLLRGGEKCACKLLEELSISQPKSIKTNMQTKSHRTAGNLPHSAVGFICLNLFSKRIRRHGNNRNLQR